MPPDLPLHFGSYRLEGPQGPLWHHAELVALPPKALAVLWLLARQAGQVVSKATLLDTVWPETVVSEGTLTNCLSLLRHALGEDAQQPRYIATVHRLGYRFVAPVTPAEPTPALAPPPAPRARGTPPPAPPPRLVGRAAELAQLHACFAQARQGTRQTVFVTGEAGMGKTTLVDAFVAEVAAAQTAWIGWGQCIEPLLGRAKRICRCSTPWGAWAGGRRARASWRVCASMPRPGWGRCRPGGGGRASGRRAPGARGDATAGCCGSWPRPWKPARRRTPCSSCWRICTGVMSRPWRRWRCWRGGGTRRGCWCWGRTGRSS